MKFKNIQYPALLLVAVFSIGAFIFLNSVQSDSPFKQKIGIQSEAIKVEDAAEEEQSRKLKSDYLPEISAVKRVFELMRKFIPAS